MKKFLLVFLTFVSCFSAIRAVDGALDITINPGGAIPGTITNAPTASEDVLRGAVWCDGSVFAAGRSGAAPENAIVARYNALDGSLHGSFNPTGPLPGTLTLDGTGALPDLFFDPVAGGSGAATDTEGGPNMIAVDPATKKIIVVGGSSAAPSVGFGVVRLNIDGTPDTTFGPEGKRTISIGGATADVASSVILLPDGKILVGGTSNLSGAGPGDFSVVRLNNDGSVDTTFGTSGVATKVLAAGGAGPHRARDMALQSDGKILLGGHVTTGGDANIMMVRFNSDGSLDTTFGDGSNEATIDVIGAGDDSITQMVVKRDGKIFLVGLNASDASGGFIAQFNSDGTADTTFSATGAILLSTFAPFAGTDGPRTAILQPDDKMLFAGSTDIDGGAGSFFVARLTTAHNVLDTTFDGDGKVTTAVTVNSDEIDALLLQPDGKIIGVGWANVGGGVAVLALARYEDAHADTLDSTSNLKYQNLFSK